MSDLVSIIVPIYGVEEYLSKCIDSIINQTYKNLEIILVDDGSPDKCPDICDAYGKVAVQGFIEKAKNAGMKAIHLYADKENKAALNMYGKLGFVDWIIPDERRPEDKHLIRWIL